MGLFRKERKYAFSDILNGLQCAVENVSEAWKQRQAQHLNKFWKEEDGSPVCRKVKIGDKVVNVPLVSLVPHNQLAMESMEVRLRLRLKEVEVYAVDSSSDQSGQPAHTELQVEIDKSGTAADGKIDVTVRFKLQDVTPGITCLTDNYINQV